MSRCPIRRHHRDYLSTSGRQRDDRRDSPEIAALVGVPVPKTSPTPPRQLIRDIAYTRISTLRWAVATVLGVGVVVLVNQLRLGLIAWATLTWGLNPGYAISHTFVGSALAVLGFACAIILMLIVMNRRQRLRPAQ